MLKQNKVVKIFIKLLSRVYRFKLNKYKRCRNVKRTAAGISEFS